jgi:hypothetical protein
MMTVTDADRQAAIREVLLGGYCINAWEAGMLGRLFGIPAATILADVQSLGGNANYAWPPPR